MAFDFYESSTEEGRPIYLYRFTLNSLVWRFTSADADIEAAGALWAAVPISDDGVKLTGESVTDALTITTSSKIEPAQIYMRFPPSSLMQVAILRTHDEDFDDIKTVYVGEVTQCNVPTPGTAVFTCETLASTMKREGLRMAWQRDCPHALYDPNTCRVNKVAFGVLATATLAENGHVKAPELNAYPWTYFPGGFIEWLDPDRGIERRTIEAQGPDGLIRLFGTGDGIEVGQQFTAYPGCAHNTDACKGFGNLLNYGGIPDLAGKSPFDGDPVFI